MVLPKKAMGLFKMLTFDTKDQKKIVNFLDKRAVDMDTVITKKQKQISLLKKYRTTIINEVVVRGRNPKVKMRNSGIEWLGKIPEHWKVKKLKYSSKINWRSLPENTDTEYRFYYIDISNVNQDGLINPPREMVFKNSPSRARRIVKKGDTITSTVNTHLKTIAYIESDRPNLIASTGFAVVTPNKDILPKFLYYLIRNQKIIDTATSLSVGTCYPAINLSKLNLILIWYPNSLEEQENIINYLEKINLQINKIIEKLETQIFLLKQHQTSLIPKVVTGKIDVRGVKI